MISGALTAQLERALLRELMAEWRSVNQLHFKGALSPPAIELGTHATRLGRWDRSTRSIELSRALVLAHGWGVVVEVLKHEMAHQYVHEVLGESDESAHGPAFRQVCERLGIDAAASGIPRAPRAEGEERMVERVARLLALAESPNVHEAEAAASAAQRLMLKYNLDVQRRASGRDYGYVHVGKPTGRVMESERILAMLLGKHFFVEVIWVPVYRPLDSRRGSLLELCGSPANLAMAEYVHGYLTHTAERLWEEHKRSNGVGSNRERRTFLAGVMAGFADKLARQQAAHLEQGLVWVGDGDLTQYFRRRHPCVRHVRHAGQRRTAAYAHGRAAGRRIVLRKAVDASPSHFVRLLPKGQPSGSQP